MALQTAFQIRNSDETPAACVPNAWGPYTALALEAAGLQGSSSRHPPCLQSDPCIHTCSVPCSTVMCCGTMETPKLQGQEGEMSYGYHLRIAPSTRHPPAPATQGLLCHSTKEGGICFHCSKLHLFPHSSMFVQVIPPGAIVLFCYTRMPFHFCLRKRVVNCCLLCLKTW